MIDPVAATLAKMRIPLSSSERYVTVNGRFVHRGVGMHTICGANTVGRGKPTVDVTLDKALKMHVCGKCWKE